MYTVTRSDLPILDLFLRRRMIRFLSRYLSDIDLYLNWFGHQFSMSALFKYYTYLLGKSEVRGRVFFVADLISVAVVSRHRMRSKSIWLATCYIICLVHPGRWIHIASIIKNIYDLHRLRPYSDYYYLDAIATANEYRNIGLASALLYDIYDSIKCEGGGVLVCDTSTEGLIHLLNKHDWAKIGVTSIGGGDHVSTFAIPIDSCI
jgi:hypothetical protein